MPILLAAAMLAGAPLAPPAPPAPPPITIVTSPPSPPSPAAYRRMMDRLTQPPAILDIRVSGAGGLLWEGTLRVGSSGAAVSQERTEAQAASCPPEASSYGRSVRTSFMMSLTSPAYVQTEEDLYAVNIGWTRLATSDGCARDGSRTVQLQTSIAIPAHGSATLHGDAGLTVEIHRR